MRKADRVTEFISEILIPTGGRNTAAMARGEPGLPAGFEWRDRHHDIVSCLAGWKESSREGGVGELYLRRHYYRLKMADGAEWTVYFMRQRQAGGAAKERWFLYKID